MNLRDQSINEQLLSPNLIRFSTEASTPDEIKYYLLLLTEECFKYLLRSTDDVPNFIVEKCGSKTIADMNKFKELKNSIDTLTENSKSFNEAQAKLTSFLQNQFSFSVKTQLVFNSTPKVTGSTYVWFFNKELSFLFANKYVLKYNGEEQYSFYCDGTRRCLDVDKKEKFSENKKKSLKNKIKELENMLARIQKYKEDKKNFNKKLKNGEVSRKDEPKLKISHWEDGEETGSEEDIEKTYKKLLKKHSALEEELSNGVEIILERHHVDPPLFCKIPLPDYPIDSYSYQRRIVMERNEDMRYNIDSLRDAEETYYSNLENDEPIEIFDQIELGDFIEKYDEWDLNQPSMLAYFTPRKTELDKHNNRENTTELIISSKNLGEKCIAKNMESETRPAISVVPNSSLIGIDDVVAEVKKYFNSSVEVKNDFERSYKNIASWKAEKAFQEANRTRKPVYPPEIMIDYVIILDDKDPASHFVYRMLRKIIVCLRKKSELNAIVSEKVKKEMIERNVWNTCFGNGLSYENAGAYTSNGINVAKQIDAMLRYSRKLYMEQDKIYRFDESNMTKQQIEQQKSTLESVYEKKSGSGNLSIHKRIALPSSLKYNRKGEKGFIEAKNWSTIGGDNKDFYNIIKNNKVLSNALDNLITLISKYDNVQDIKHYLYYLEVHPTAIEQYVIWYQKEIITANIYKTFQVDYFPIIVNVRSATIDRKSNIDTKMRSNEEILDQLSDQVFNRMINQIFFDNKDKLSSSIISKINSPSKIYEELINRQFDEESIFKYMDARHGHIFKHIPDYNELNKDKFWRPTGYDDVLYIQRIKTPSQESLNIKKKYKNTSRSSGKSSRSSRSSNKSTDEEFDSKETEEEMKEFKKPNVIKTYNKSNKKYEKKPVVVKTNVSSNPFALLENE